MVKQLYQHFFLAMSENISPKKCFDDRKKVDDHA